MSSSHFGIGWRPVEWAYLHWLIQGFQEGRERGIVMVDAAERYRREWGDDMILVASRHRRAMIPETAK